MSLLESGLLFVLAPWLGLLTLFALAEGLDRLSRIGPDASARARIALRLLGSTLVPGGRRDEPALFLRRLSCNR